MFPLFGFEEARRVSLVVEVTQAVVAVDAGSVHAEEVEGTQAAPIAAVEAQHPHAAIDGEVAAGPIHLLDVGVAVVGRDGPVERHG